MAESSNVFIQLDAPSFKCFDGLIALIEVDGQLVQFARELVVLFVCRGSKLSCSKQKHNAATTHWTHLSRGSLS